MGKFASTAVRQGSRLLCHSGCVASGKFLNLSVCSSVVGVTVILSIDNTDAVLWDWPREGCQGTHSLHTSCTHLGSRSSGGSRLQGLAAAAGSGGGGAFCLRAPGRGRLP